MAQSKTSGLARVFRIVGLIAGLWVIGQPAFAVPMLQLGIGGGSYDLVTETIVSSETSFTLYAYGKAFGNKSVDVNESHFISVAITPQIGPDPVPFGSFTFAGSTYDINSPEIGYGHPPLEEMLEHDPGDLPGHGQFPTFFVEHEFLFSETMKTGLVNTQDSPSHVPAPGGNKLYFAAFEVDVSNMISGFGLHFDLYNTQLKNGGDVDIDNFAPFSHDAGTVPSVPEPSTLLLLVFGLMSQRFFLVRRRSC